MGALEKDSEEAGADSADGKGEDRVPTCYIVTSIVLGLFYFCSVELSVLTLNCQ
jgi:hypothetical protein